MSTDTFGRSSPRPRAIRLAFLLVILAAIGSYALFFSALAPWPLTDQRDSITRSSGGRPTSPAAMREVPRSLLDTPARDHRMTAAFVDALALRQRLAETAPVPVRVDLQDGTGEEFRTVFDLGDETVEVTLSSAPGAEVANIETLRTALADLVPELPPSPGVETDDRQDALRHLTGSRGILPALAELDRELHESDDPTGRLREASELLAWLAIMKNPMDNRALADLFATRALAAWLAATASSTASPGNDLGLGLVLLALDYPAAALSRLEPAADKDPVSLLRAYLERDIEGLRAIYAEGDPALHRMAGYLLVQASAESLLGAASYQPLQALLRDYPDYLLAEELAASFNVVGVSNRHVVSYPVNLLESHLEQLYALMEPASLEGDEALLGSARRATSPDDSLEKWIEVHQRILDQPLELRHRPALLSTDLVKTVLRQEMQDALYYRFLFEARPLGRLPETEKLAELIQSRYPGTPLSRTVEIVKLEAYGDPEAMRRHLATLTLDGADRLLLYTLLYEHWAWVMNVKGFPQVLEALERLRQVGSPSRSDLLDLLRSLGKSRLTPYAQTTLAHLAEVAPFDYRVASQAREFGFEDFDVAAYTKRIEHLPTVATLLGRVFQDRGDQERAMEYFRKAIERNPADSKPYFKLGALYREREQPDEAIAVYQAYLEHDRTTLSRIAMINRIGKIELDRGSVDRAYDLYAQAKDSGQAGAMLGFARASEASGRLLQAEQTLKQAAERYPSTTAPAELAMFYLRQGNRGTAVQTLEEYARFNRVSYYFDALVDQLGEDGNAKDAAAIVREVAPEHWSGNLVRNVLAGDLMERGYPRLAAELYGELALRAENPRKYGPYLYAAKYLEASEAAVPGSREGVIDALMDHYEPMHPTVMEYLGNHLLTQGMPEAALEVLEHRYEMAELRRDVILVMSALAWRRAGAGDADAEARIRDRLAALDGDPWVNERVRFLLGDMEEAEILAEATGAARQCEVQYFLGSLAAQRGDTGAAERHLVASLQTRAVDQIEYMHAYDLLKALTEDVQDGS